MKLRCPVALLITLLTTACSSLPEEGADYEEVNAGDKKDGKSSSKTENEPKVTGEDDTQGPSDRPVPSTETPAPAPSAEPKPAPPPAPAIKVSVDDKATPIAVGKATIHDTQIWVSLDEPSAAITAPHVFLVLERSGSGCGKFNQGMHQSLAYTRTGYESTEPFRYDPPDATTSTCGLSIKTFERRVGGKVVGTFDGDLTKTGTTAGIPAKIRLRVTFEVTVTE